MTSTETVARNYITIAYGCSHSYDYDYSYNLPEQARSQVTDDYYEDNPDRSYAFQFADNGTMEQGAHQ